MTGLLGNNDNFLFSVSILGEACMRLQEGDTVMRTAHQIQLTTRPAREAL